MTTQQQEVRGRALQLLQDVCTKEQWKEYQKTGNIMTVGSKTARNYLVTKDGGVFAAASRSIAFKWDLVHKVSIVAYCIGFKRPDDVMPRNYDASDLRTYRIESAIALKLLIESDEDLFLKTAK